MPVTSTQIWDIRKRSISSNDLNFTRSNFLGRKEFVQRLKLETTFEVHEGSVNTICWNDTGEYILSGSNDNNLVITNPFSRKVMAKIKSKHGSNIHCARFMPQTNDHIILSAAADGKIFYTNIAKGPSVVTQYQYHCHIGAAYKILTVPNDPHSFLSCGEDGAIRWFDVRISPECWQSNCKKDILIDCRRAVTSMAVSPVDPFYLAAGCSDSSVRIYDRRMLGTISTGCHSGSGASGMCARFVPLNLINKSWRVTSLNYSQDGREVLAGYASDYVYLFDPKDDKGRELKALSQDIRNEPRQVPVKRLRLRGDWSDTGPLARPESERERDGDPRSNVSLMQRMSDIMSQWFEEASEAHVRALPQPGPRGSATLPEGASPPSGPSPQTSLDVQGVSGVADSGQPRPTAATSSDGCPFVCGDTQTDSSPASESRSSTQSSRPGDHDGTVPPVVPSNTPQFSQTGEPDTGSRSVASHAAGSFLPLSAEPVLNLSYSTEGTTASTIQLDFSHLWSSAGHHPRATSNHTPITSRAAQSSHPPQPEGGALLQHNPSSSSQTDSSLPHLESSEAPERTDSEPVEAMDVSADSSHDEGLSGMRGQPERLSQNQGDDDGDDMEDESPSEPLRSGWGLGFNLRGSALGERVLRRSAAVRIQEIFRRRKERLELAESETRHIKKPSVKMIYKGHRNSRTMTKEACFWGEHFVMSGSDCGHIFIWDRHTGEHLMLLEADNHVVNCLQPHPYEPLLATSGIDYNVKIWSPFEEFPSFNRSLAEEVISRNELMLEETRNTITVPASFMLRMLASLNHTFRAESEAERSEGSGQENEDDQ